MKPAFSLKSPLLLALSFSACVAASCDEKGATSICPPLPRYTSFPLGDAAPADASAAGAAQAELAAAVDAGCATAPTLFPFDSSAGAAGEAGSGPSSAGHAGTSASAGTGGSAGSAGDAGAAGAN
jgi:hypothetical protein